MSNLITKITARNQNSGLPETKDIGVKSENIIGDIRGDWNESNSNSVNYVKNKPDIPIIEQENLNVKRIRVGSNTYTVACRSTQSGNVIKENTDGCYLGISNAQGNIIQNKSDGLFANLNASYEAQNENLILCQ